MSTKKRKYTCTGTVWLYSGETSSWHFLSVPKKESLAIKEAFGASAKGWGSLPVVAQIGKTAWKTSIFPDKRSGSYLLPLKAKVRAQEGLFDGDRVTYSFTVQKLSTQT